MKLQIKTPTPSDIDIAQAVTPAPIGDIAKAIGILPSELLPYGHHKAKASRFVIAVSIYG